MSWLLQEAEYAMRRLVRTPATQLAIMALLAISIAVAGSVWTFRNDTVAAPIGAKSPDQLYVLSWRAPQGIQRIAQAGAMRYLDRAGNGNSVTGATWPWAVWQSVESVTKRQTAFKTFAWAPLGKAWYGESEIAIAFRGETSLVRADMVSTDYFSVLGVPPMVGRTIGFDDLSSERPVAVISERLWKKDFGNRDLALQSTITIDSVKFDVIGVMPGSFEGLIKGLPTEVWVPLGTKGIRYWGQNQFGPREHPSWGLTIGARTTDAASLAAADQEIAAAARNAIIPSTASGDTLGDIHLQLAERGIGGLLELLDWPTTALGLLALLVLLSALVGIVMIAIERANQRSVDARIRLAIGADQTRLIMAVVIEWFVVAMFSSAIAVVIAPVVWGYLIELGEATGGPYGLTADHFREGAQPIALMLLSILMAMVPCAVEVLKLTQLAKARGDRQERLVVSLTTTANVAAKPLLVVQALCGVTLAALALTAAISAQKLLDLDLGLNTDRLLIFDAHAPSPNIVGSTSIGQLLSLQERIRRLPGVSSVTSAVLSPGVQRGAMIRIVLPSTDKSMEGHNHPQASDGQKTGMAKANMVGPNYLTTLGIGVLAGRDISNLDTSTAPRVCVVSEALAERVYGRRDVVGEVVQLPGQEPAQIVGVAANTVYESIYEFVERPAAVLYMPYTQLPPAGFDSVHFSVKWTADRSGTIEGIRRVFRDDPNLFALGVFDDQAHVLNRTMWQEIAARRFGLFGAAIIVSLSSIGIWSSVTQLVGRRRRELCIRQALGAGATSLCRTVAGGTLVSVGIGCALGVWASLVAGKGLSAFVHGLQQPHLVTLIVAVLVVAAAAAIGAFLPARAAMRADFAAVLREQ